MNFDRRTFTRTLGAWLGLAAARSVGATPGADTHRADGSGSPVAHGGPIAGLPTTGITLTDVEGIRVGHRVRDDRPTGCTAIIAPDGATGGVDVRGAAPGTRELALLDPTRSVDVVHAVLLSGGSAFGLAAADGLVRWLRENGIGLPFGGDVIPIVPGAILFDLGVGGNSTPDADDGYRAAAAASDAPVEQGNVGAGAGATVGKMFGGDSAMKGGFGSAGYRFHDGTVVAAAVAVNARGDVLDPATGTLVAGARSADGGLRDTRAALLAGDVPAPDGAERNTTIGVVATNLALDKAACNRLASVAHDGLARAIAPAHTRWDGDTLFALATGKRPAPASDREIDRLDVAAAAAMAQAILAAIAHAESLPGLPSARDYGTWPPRAD